MFLWNSGLASVKIEIIKSFTGRLKERLWTTERHFISVLS